MEHTDRFVWISLGPAVLHALALVPVIRRLRGPDSAVRSKARLDLLETVGNILFLGGLLLSLVVAEAWFRWFRAHERRLRREGRPPALRPPLPHGLVRKTGPF